MRVVKFLIALPVLVYAAAMGYLWLHVKNSADDMIKNAAGFAAIQYDSVHTSLLGDEIGLNNIVIKPNMTNDEFRIEKLRLSAPHIGYFMQADTAFKKGSLPEMLGVSIQRIHVDLSSEIFSMMEQMQQQAAAQQGTAHASVLDNIDSLGCGENHTLTLADYRDMGIGNIVADASFNLEFDKSTNRATIHAYIKADKLYTINLQTGFDANQGRLLPGTTPGTIPDMQISYSDTGMYQLRNRYCASLNQSDVESYVNQHIQLASEQLGVILPETFLLAYRDYMLHGGTIHANLNPVDNINVSSLQYYPPDEVMHMLGLSVTINGKTLDNRQIRWTDGGKRPRPGKRVESNPRQATKSVPSRPLVRKNQETSMQNRQVAKYHQVDITNAKKHINRLVEVTLYNGRVRKGILDNINEGRIYLVIELRGGSLSYPVKISDVKRLMVRY